LVMLGKQKNMNHWVVLLIIMQWGKIRRKIETLSVAPSKGEEIERKQVKES
jgi:hypothetical protein